MTNYELAREIATQAHSGQVDKSGVDYIYHPLHVAEQVEGEEAKVVALLHDVVEDTPITLEDLDPMFPQVIMQALRLLTHEPGIPYDEYIDRVAKNPIAREVKIADLTHNMDLSRYGDAIPEDAYKRQEKYSNAIERLRLNS